MRRPGKRSLIVTTTALVVLGVVTLLLYWLVLPPYVHARIEAALREVGVQHADFSLRNVSLSDLRIERMTLGRPDWLKVNAIHAWYSLGSLLSGRVEALEISDAQWTIRRHHGQWTFGPTLRGGDAELDIPFNRLTLRNAIIEIETENATHRIPAHGSIVRQPGGRYAVDLTCRVPHRPIRIAGTLDDRGDDFAFDLAITEVDEPDNRLAITGAYNAAGDVRFSASIDSQVSAFEFEYAAQTVSVTDLQADLMLELGEGAQVRSLHGKIESGGVVVAGRAAEGVSLSFETNDQSIVCTAAAQGEDWRLHRLETDMRQAIAALRSDAGGSFPATVHFTSSQPHSILLPVTERFAEMQQLGEMALQTTAKVHLPGAGSAETWRVEFPDAHLTVAPSDFALAQANLAAAGLNAELYLAGELDPSRITIAARQGGSVSLHALRQTLGERQIEVGALRAAIAPSAEQPLLNVPYGLPDAPMHYAFSLSAHSIAAKADDISATLGTASIAASIEVPEDEPVIFRGNVQLTDAAAIVESIDFRAQDIQANVPIAINAPADGPGSFSFGSIAFGADRNRLTGPSGELTFAHHRIDASLRWNLPDLTTITGDGWIDFSGEASRGEFAAHAPRFEVTDPDALGRLLPALRNVDFGGAYMLEARIQIADGQVEPRVQLVAENARVVNEDWLLQVESASGSIVIDSFAPLATAGPQLVIVHRGSAFGIEFTEGVIEYSMTSADALMVTRADWNMGDYGQFRASAFRMDPKQPRIDTQIECHHVGLNAWLPLLSNGRATGSGTLGGWMALSVDPAAERVLYFGSSFLAEEGPGWIRVMDEQAVANMLESSGIGEIEVGGDARLAEMRQRVIRAIQDFAYRMFQVELIPEIGDTLCQIQIAGRGRQGPEPVEIGGLTVNIHDFNTVMNQVLQAQSGLRRGER